MKRTAVLASNKGGALLSPSRHGFCTCLASVFDQLVCDLSIVLARAAPCRCTAYSSPTSTSGVQRRGTKMGTPKTFHWMTHRSAIKLIRTEAALDLGQKAEKCIEGIAG